MPATEGFLTLYFQPKYLLVKENPSWFQESALSERTSFYKESAADFTTGEEEVKSHSINASQHTITKHVLPPRRPGIVGL